MLSSHTFAFVIMIVSLSMKVTINCNTVLNMKYAAQHTPNNGRLAGKGSG